MTRTPITCTHIRLMALNALLALAAAAVACGGDDDDDGDSKAPTSGASSPTSGATQPAGQAVTIGIADNKYEPATQTIQKGSRVTWTWNGKNPHSVEGKFNGQDVKSERQTSGKFEFTFAQAGTFDYQCGVHGAAMAGKVTVQ